MVGHAGIHITYGRLSENFFGKGIKKDVAKFGKGCVLCEQIKSSTQLPYGLLQPISRPTVVLKDISLDFFHMAPFLPNLYDDFGYC